MKMFAATILSGFVFGSALASACNCRHSEDAGTWIHDLRPSLIITQLCNEFGGCIQGEERHMCLQGDMTQCACAEQAARAWESNNDEEWYLWSAVNCDNLIVTLN